MSSIVDAFTNLHFIRPTWLHALWLTPLLLFSASRAVSRWEDVIDARLLRRLRTQPATQHKRRWHAPVAAALIWIIGILASAGPSVHKQDLPVYETRDAVVYLLDLSLSMYAQDVKPSRLQLARFQLRDMLQAQQETWAALVFFAGDAYLAAPITYDRETLINLLEAAEPAIMPVVGSRPDLALQVAKQAIAAADVDTVHYVLLTDEINEQDVKRIDPLLERHERLSLLRVGSDAGAPIPLPNGKLLTDAKDHVVIARADEQGFADLARQTGSAWTTATLGGDEGVNLLDAARVMQAAKHEGNEQHSVAYWADSGYWLLLLLVPLWWWTPRTMTSWLSPFVCVALFSVPGPSEAASWLDLFRNDNQQAAALLADDPAAASERFSDPRWKAHADYRAGDFAAAASHLTDAVTADDFYNRGNAHARAGRIADAIADYDRALALEPGHADAQFNRELLANLPEQPNHDQQQDQQQKSDDASSQDQNAGNDGNGEGKKSDNGNDENAASSKSNKDASEQANASRDGKQNTGNDSNRSKDRNAGQNTDKSSDAQSRDKAGDKRGNKGEAEPDQNGSDSKQPAASSTREEARSGSPGERPANDGSAQDEPNAEQAETPSAADERDSAGDAQPADVQLDPAAEDRWLHRIQNDPSGLLRRKFEREAQKRQTVNEDKPW